MKNFSRLLLPIALLIPFVLGCGQLQRGIEEVSTPQNTAPTSTAPIDLVANDGTTQITVPGNWSKAAAVNPDISLQAAYVPDEAYIAVIREPKSAVGRDMTLVKYTDLLQKDMPNRMTDLTVTPAAPVTIGGIEGRQFESSGTIQGHQFKYIFTVLFDGENFYQVFGWSTPARFEENRKQISDGINSFKALQKNGTPGDKRSGKK